MEKRFLKRNEKNIQELNDLIDKGNVRAIIVSSFMFYTLAEIEGLTEIVGIDVFKYRGVRVLSDVYHSDTLVSYIMKDSAIKFDVPCICGYYDDEEHGHRLK